MAESQQKISSNSERVNREDRNPQLLSSTLWNYARLFVRLGLGVILFRAYFKMLETEAFGLWAYLWAVFGCGVLLDFGFGLMVQKGVSHHRARNEWSEANMIINSTLAAFSIIGLLLAVVGCMAAESLLHAVSIEDPGKRSLFLPAVRYFFIGMGISMPLAVFHEIMKGLHEIPVLNKIMVLSAIANFAVQMVVLQNGGRIDLLVAGAVAAICVQYLWGAVYCCRRYPELKLSWNYVSADTLIKSGRFSFYGYLIILSYMIVTKTDQLIIGSLGGLAAVALYQPALKVGELFGTLTRQLSENLQPAAAHYNSLGQKEKIAGLIKTGIRWSGIIAAPLLILCICELELIVYMITGAESLPLETFASALILLIWAYSFVLTHNVLKRVLVMTGHESALVKIGLIEAALNAGLSIIFYHVTGSITGVALATLIVSAVIGWGWLWRWASRETGFQPAQLFRLSVWPSVYCQLPSLILLVAWQFWRFHNDIPGIAALMISCLINFGSAAIMTGRFALNEKERIFILDKCRIFMSRFPRLGSLSRIPASRP